MTMYKLERLTKQGKWILDTDFKTEIPGDEIKGLLRDLRKMQPKVARRAVQVTEES